MIGEFILPIGALIAITLWMALRHAFVAHQTSRQSEIARRGATCQGKIVAIQRPFMLDSCTRLYFDFLPAGVEQPLRGCHIDRRAVDELRSSLPAAGSVVTVSYLPDRPRQAVICRLAPKLA
ncbi:MAG: hypothetical protein ACREV5_05730 [Steroidobacter sp.]